ncbi:MAG: hypothetical protein NC131_20935 [Roseburia sp.]|nr:hypothetical protein [Roseburia sp.]
MPFPECKIYSDGSSFIAIPHTEGRKGSRPKHYEPIIEVVDNEEGVQGKMEETVTEEKEITADKGAGQVPVPDSPCEEIDNVNKKSAKVRLTTRKELFEELYKANLDKKLKERRQIIYTAMVAYFKNKQDAKTYVDAQFERKQRNMICRRVRLVRKINLHSFNFFCTFTYDSAKHTEKTFKKKLMQCFWNMTKRRDWQYAGVWERSPEKQRLHFHGLFDIPEGQMVGEVNEVKDYSPVKGFVQVTHQNTYFNEKFGRSDFKRIEDKSVLGESVKYLVKYLEKTGERIVYSKGLPQYFISDIMEDDVICPYGEEDSKLLLFDNFGCWDEGVYMGQVSSEVIQKMRKVN